MIDIAAHAREVLAANRYLTLATVDADGHPWTSPVYFAADGIREYYWVSRVDTRHSRNLAGDPRVSIVVFDSTVPVYHGRAVYAVGEAVELSGDDLERGLAVYPGSGDRGGRALAGDEVTGDSPYRLYRATATDVWVLCPGEPGEPCALHGITADHRSAVE